MTEHGARTTQALQQRLQDSPDEDAEDTLRLAYRTMLLDALHALPQKALPRDLGAVGIMVEAAELFAIALYFTRGTEMAKGFVREGLDELTEWLQRSRSLFERYNSLYGELPEPKVIAGDPQKVAAAYWGITNRMHRNIMEHMDVEDAVDEAHDNQSSDPETQGPRPDTVVAVQGAALKELAQALATIMCCWFDGCYVNQLMEAVQAGQESLCECRPLLMVTEPEQARGNA